ncbi:SusC/RagA family TonB-linked outer membrane protein [Dysgonomonas sp. HGC4]|uniref:SusC/RagA family TonB-linked outer membrane protein n=1 Tax=Dysgonomonas sp. HGC4 TaxID=1658009 RepID=UPI0006826F42|nr:TonB-dependent receptor [Dysgonomonas sp. HGC4]MBD8349745.1 TonB-dependent receptor [Dysgonomonas sp. HGC4]
MMKEKSIKNKRRRTREMFLLLLVGIFTFSTSLAQNSGAIQVSGTVTDNKSGETVIGASVKVKDSSTGTITDYDGNFKLDAPANATLVVSFLGYKTKEVAVGNKTKLSIILDEDSELLSEVVVIGYGQVRKGDATGALTSIKPDELNKGLQITAQDALIGRVAGVNIVPGDGAPGSGGTIRIRMGASLSADNDPLIVIDGVPVSNTSISFINPNDIETFTVLKDASATAIYGSRASNGVIIITTKKGSLGGSSKPQINYSSNFTVSKIPSYYEVLSADEYREIYKSGQISAPSDFKLGAASTDWQKEIYRTAFGNEHNLSVTGTAKQVPYRVSVGYLSQDGVLHANNYKRFNGGFGLSPKFFNKHLSVDINVKGSMERSHPVSTGAIGSAISFDPTRPVHENYAGNVGLGYYMWMDDAGKPKNLAATNPVSELELTSKLNTINRSLGNMAIDYKIHGFEDLHLNVNLGYDIRRNKEEETIPDLAPSMYTSNRSDGRGKFHLEDNKNTNYILSTYANYVKDINPKHNISAMAGYEWQRFWYSTNPRDVVKDVVDTSLPDEDVLYLLSFFGRFNYSFDQKLLFTATLRGDASSRFSPDNRWGYFPSLALGYRLTEEKFIRDIKPLSDLKLRVSYGQTGQQDIGGYHPYLSLYTISSDAAKYPFGDEWLYMYRPNGYDPNIKWETTSTYNAGLDYGFLNNRIYGSIDVYKRYTKNLLNNIYVPAGSNFTNKLETNIGDMEGQGLEFALSGIPIKTKDWEWTISGNFTYGKSKITKLNTIDSEDSYVKTGSVSRNDLQIHKIGETPNTFFLLKQAYGEDGKPLEGQYIAKDGSITTIQSDDNKYVTGKSSRTPYYYGLSTHLTYKKWDFGINGHGSFGNYVFNYQQAKQSLIGVYGDGISSNISKVALERGFSKEQYFSDHFLESGAFFKFDNITLGYTFNKLWNTSSSLRMAFSAQNIAIISNYSGADPEIYNGIDNNTYQRPRTYTLSLNLNF